MATIRNISRCSSLASPSASPCSKSAPKKDRILQSPTINTTTLKTIDRKLKCCSILAATKGKKRFEISYATPTSIKLPPTLSPPFLSAFRRRLSDSVAIAEEEKPRRILSSKHCWKIPYLPKLLDDYSTPTHATQPLLPSLFRRRPSIQTTCLEFGIMNPVRKRKMANHRNESQRP